MRDPQADQNLGAFLRAGQSEPPPPPKDLEDRIWLLANARKNEPLASAARPLPRWIPVGSVAAIAAAAAAALALWPLTGDEYQEDTELEAFVEASWDGTFDETSADYVLADADD